MKNRLRQELEAMLELHTGDSFTADNVHTLVNGIFAADEGGGFEFVEYDDIAFPNPQEIGDTASSISGLGPADENMVKTIFIMPNKSTNPDATLMIVVDEVDPPTDPKTYQYVYVGNINDLPSDVLTEGSVVDIPGTDSDSVMSQKGVTDLTSEYNVSINNDNAEYTFSQAVALVPASLQKGGLTIKYIDSTSHEYAIKRLMSSTWNTTESNWQGIDDEPTIGSDNLVKSGGVKKDFCDLAYLSGMLDGEKDTVKNFEYFILKDVSLLSHNPRLVAIYVFPNTLLKRILIELDNGTQFSYDDTYFVNDEHFLFRYNWDAYDPTKGVSHSYSSAKITITGDSTFSKSIIDIYSKIGTLESSLNPKFAQIYIDLNADRFYDVTNSTYESTEILIRNITLPEVFIQGEPIANLAISRFYQVSTSIKRLHFILTTEQLWAFVIDKPIDFNGISLESVQYQGRTIYLVVNWGSEYWGYNTVDKNIIISNGCYSLDNNPAISAHIKKLSFDDQIQEVENTIENIENNIRTSLLDYEITKSKLTEYLENGKYLHNGEIKTTSSTANGLICIPVKTGDIYHISIAQIQTHQAYDAIAFCEDTNVGSNYDTIVAHDSEEYMYNIILDYRCKNDGYLLIWTSSDGELASNKIRVYQMIQTNPDQLHSLFGLNKQPLISQNQFKSINYIESDTMNVQYHQKPYIGGFVGEVCNIGINVQKSYLIIDIPEVTAKLRQYQSEDGRRIYPIRIGCRVFNKNSHSAYFNLGFRYKVNGDASWHLPEVGETEISANSYKDFEYLVDYNIDFNNLSFEFGFYSYLKGSVGDNFIIGNTYIIWEDPKQRDVSFIDYALITNKPENLSNPIYPALKKKIICSGSSITWGTGALESSMVAKLDDFVKEELSQTILANDMKYSSKSTTIYNALLYKGYGKQISNINDTIEFDSYGDELAICHVKKRTTDYGIVEVYADNILIGSFDNKNIIKSETETFSDSDIRTIRLKHPCTFNHNITVNGSTQLTKIIYNEGGYGGTVPADQTTFDAFVFRALDSNGDPVHKVQFSTELGTITSVTITYDYGHIEAYEKSTVGQTNNANTNESYYGEGITSYDPDHPASGLSSGMEFRAANKNAFFIHQFTSVANRHIKIKLIGGSNPYFIVNFATNRYHDIMNAGIGGWTIRLLIDDNKINDYTQFFKYFKPEIIFQESETNDDWSYSTRRISRSLGEITLQQLRALPWLEVKSVTYNSGTDKYDVVMCTGIISEITPQSLTSADIIGTNTQVGDIVRIGTYHGDIKQITCREITTVDLTTGTIEWIEPISVDEMINVSSIEDLIGAEINIRDLSEYKTHYKTYIEKVHAVTPEAKIVIVDNGLPMLGLRQLWGYDVIHRKIAQESTNVEYCDARSVLYDGEFAYISGNLNNRKESIISNGSSEYELTFEGAIKSWCGFKVLVNGVDVYGKDCYVQCQGAYRAKSTLSGSSLNKTNPYTRNNASDSENPNMKLVFTQNVPVSGATIEVQYADEIWSSDYCHPANFGSFLYGKAYIKHIM